MSLNNFAFKPVDPSTKVDSVHAREWYSRLFDFLQRVAKLDSEQTFDKEQRFGDAVVFSGPITLKNGAATIYPTAGASLGYIEIQATIAGVLTPVKIQVFAV